MVLSWGWHLYAELVFDQRSETWLRCHAHAFTCFGGVPARVVPDNLKAAVGRASFTEPVAQQAYRSRRIGSAPRTPASESTRPRPAARPSRARSSKGASTT